MYLTALATNPLVPRRLFTSLKSLRMKSKRPSSNGGGVGKSPERAGVNLRSELSFETFASVIEARREEAKRTIVVQVLNEFAAEELFLYSEKHCGKVRSLRFHKNSEDEVFSSFYLVEFDTSDGVRAAVDGGVMPAGGGTSADGASMPIRSPFMWLRGKASEKATSIPIYIPVHGCENAKKNKTDNATFDAKVLDLYERTKMTETSTRLRFLACEQVEGGISGMFPRARVVPFGSSVNSFGTSTSDLDMVVKLEWQGEMGNGTRDVNEAREDDESQLVLHAKECRRNRGGLFLGEFSNIVRAFLPGCQNVVDILHARVPIVKYNQRFLGLSCDLSAGSLSGYHMSEILYLYGELDARVRPLVFFIRRWAKAMNIIEEVRPTLKPTNFTITLMVLFFLQQKKMLPPFELLKRSAEKKDHIFCDDGVDCTFRRDIDGMQPDLNQLLGSPESPTLMQLLAEFFIFYSSFDYEAKKICVITARVMDKNATAAAVVNPASPLSANSAPRGRDLYRNKKTSSYDLFVTNPLEPDINVSANVREKGVEKIRQECKIAADIMDKIASGKMKEDPELLIGSPGGGQMNLGLRVANLWPLKNSREVEHQHQASKQPGRISRLHATGDPTDWRKKHLRKKAPYKVQNLFR